MVYMAPLSEKSTMSCQERPSAAGHLHSSAHSCTEIPERSQHSYPGVDVLPALSTSLSDFSDKSMVGEESPPLSRTCGNSSSVYQGTAASSAWLRSENNFAAKSLTALGMSGTSAQRAFSSSQNRESSNRGADCSEELDCSAVIGNDWTQFMNTGSAFFLNAPVSMLPSSNSIAHSSLIVGRSHGGNDSSSNDDGPGTSHLSSALGHPGSGYDNINNHTPTGNTWSTLNTSSCQRLIMDPSNGGLALQRVRLSTSQPLAEFASDLEFAARFPSLPGEICSQHSHSLHALADGRTSSGKLACPAYRHSDYDGKLSSTSASFSELRIPVVSTVGGFTGAGSKHPECTFEGQGKKVIREVQESAIQLKPADTNLDDGEPRSLLQLESFKGATDITSAITECGESAGHGFASCAEQASENNMAFQASRGGTPGLGKRKTTSQERDNNLCGNNLSCSSGRDAKLTESEEPTAKHFKSADGDNGNKSKAERSTSDHSGGSSPQSTKDNGPKPPEHPKQDYIHVRARRGQATDSHSLAERVRREKISERMKFLQDLVPGCSKVTGKAVMLDEIINYVQSLQHQVEFLSMKLAAVNPRFDFHLDSIFQKMLQSCASPPTTLMGSDQSVHREDPLHAEYQVPFQLASPCGADFRALRAAASEAYLRQSQTDPLCTQLAGTGRHGEPVSQTSSALDGELQSVVQMGFKADWSSSHNAIKGQSFTTPWRSATSHSSY